MVVNSGLLHRMVIGGRHLLIAVVVAMRGGATVIQHLREHSLLLLRVIAVLERVPPTVEAHVHLPTVRDSRAVKELLVIVLETFKHVL